MKKMDKIESYLTELSNQIKTRYPESIIQSSFSHNGELGDVVMKIYLPEEVDAELATTITNHTLDILLEADVLIATLWNDSGQSWKKLSKTPINLSIPIDLKPKPLGARARR